MYNQLTHHLLSAFSFDLASFQCQLFSDIIDLQCLLLEVYIWLQFLTNFYWCLVGMYTQTQYYIYFFPIYLWDSKLLYLSRCFNVSYNLIEASINSSKSNVCSRSSISQNNGVNISRTSDGSWDMSIFSAEMIPSQSESSIKKISWNFLAFFWFNNSSDFDWVVTINADLCFLLWKNHILFALFYLIPSLYSLSVIDVWLLSFFINGGLPTFGWNKGCPICFNTLLPVYAVFDAVQYPPLSSPPCEYGRISVFEKIKKKIFEKKYVLELTLN